MFEAKAHMWGLKPNPKSRIVLLPTPIYCWPIMYHKATFEISTFNKYFWTKQQYRVLADSTILQCQENSNNRDEWEEFKGDFFLWGELCKEHNFHEIISFGWGVWRIFNRSQ